MINAMHVFRIMLVIHFVVTVTQLMSLLQYLYDMSIGFHVLFMAVLHA